MSNDLPGFHRERVDHLHKVNKMLLDVLTELDSEVPEPSSATQVTFAEQVYSLIRIQVAATQVEVQSFVDASEQTLELTEGTYDCTD